MKRRIYFRPEDFEAPCGPCPPLPGRLFEEKYDISRGALKAYERLHGVTGVRHVFDTQRRNAWERGITWELTLRQWIEIWGDKISRRGQGKDKLMMCRRDDKGPYSPANVYVGTAYENATDRHVKRRIAGWGQKPGGVPTGY